MRIRMKHITIDGNKIPVLPQHKNIVDVARSKGIGIPAPCYLQKRQHGCCNGCVVLVNGAEAYACTVKPREGMTVVVNTPELKALRKERLSIYADAIAKGEKLPCNCGDGCGDGAKGSGNACGCGEDGCC